jgi:hypothetical protein
MKAWTVDPATKQLSLRELPIPVPRRGAVTVRNDWLIVGQFMDPKEARVRLVRLAASGQLRLGAVVPRTADLPRAMDAAATMRGLEITALVTEPR